MICGSGERVEIAGETKEGGEPVFIIVGKGVFLSSSPRSRGRETRPCSTRRRLLAISK